jgi:hypothetical protein
VVHRGLLYELVNPPAQNTGAAGKAAIIAFAHRHRI